MIRKLINWLTGNKDVEAQGYNVRKYPRTRPTKPQVINEGPIHFYLNDPSTPDLLVERELPKETPLKVFVAGYAGGGYKIGTAEALAAQCLVCLTDSINYILSQSPKPIKKWAVSNILRVIPRAGEDFNAYYDRNSLKFFHNSKSNYKMIYTAESNDIVSHELGHALLDAIRPDFWHVQSHEVWAFHEAFGDCNAVLSIMQHEKILEHAINETNGDLSKSNIISKLAEELGMAITRVNSLRDVVNDYKYQKPENLPNKAADEVLSRECHSFGRIWTGAWYEMLAEIYKRNLENGMTALAALIAARDTAAFYLLYAVSYVPLTLRLYNALAKQMLIADETRGKPYQDIITNVFEKRNILSPEIKMLRMWDWDWKWLSKKDEVYKVNNHKVIRITALNKIKLKDYLTSELSALSVNPLFDVEIEVPVEKGYVVDNNNRVIDVIESSDETIVQAAFNCLEDLNSQGLVGDDINTPFSIIDGKLIRTRACMYCCFNNADDPNAPEYGKKWKPQHNKGCGCGSATETTPETPPKLGCIVKSTVKNVVSYNSRNSTTSHRGC